MSSYLFVAFLGSGTFFVIQDFQNGVLAELFLDIKNGSLYFTFFGKFFFFFPFVEALLSFIGRENRFRASNSAANREDKTSVQSEDADGIPNF